MPFVIIALFWSIVKIFNIRAQSSTAFSCTVWFRLPFSRIVLSPGSSISMISLFNVYSIFLFSVHAIILVLYAGQSFSSPLHTNAISETGLFGLFRAIARRSPLAKQLNLCYKRHCSPPLPTLLSQLSFLPLDRALETYSLVTLGVWRTTFTNFFTHFYHFLSD